jgi:hypothetical protein
MSYQAERNTQYDPYVFKPYVFLLESIRRKSMRAFQPFQVRVPELKEPFHLSVEMEEAGQRDHKGRRETGGRQGISG